jgi:hypothetical protein
LKYRRDLLAIPIEEPPNDLPNLLLHGGLLYPRRMRINA